MTNEILVVLNEKIEALYLALENSETEAEHDAINAHISDLEWILEEIRFRGEM